MEPFNVGEMPRKMRLVLPPEAAGVADINRLVNEALRWYVCLSNKERHESRVLPMPRGRNHTKTEVLICRDLVEGLVRVASTCDFEEDVVYTAIYRHLKQNR